MKIGKVEVPFGGQNLILETGSMAKQANGAVKVTYGGTVVLVSACMSKEPREGIDFFPLTVEFQEKTYAAGRIPGGFFKREGRPSESEILSARMIDRPIRPLFPEGCFLDVQIVSIVLSSDGDNDPDILGINGASAALMISDIPFDGPIAAVRVGLMDDQFILNPTYAQREKSSLDIIVVAREDQVIMIEGEANEVPEEKVIEAVEFGLKRTKNILEIQHAFVKENGKKKADISFPVLSEKLVDKVRSLAKPRLEEIYQLSQKEEREEGISLLTKELCRDLTIYESLGAQGEELAESHVKQALHKVEQQEVRRMILKEKRRVDGRSEKDVRSVSCEVNVLPRTHGSGLFTRGQTQSLAITTLGTKTDEQLIEALEGKSNKVFMLHYNFPSFSVGETRPMRGPGRREIGHGALAEKAIRAVMPTKDEFPYTVRIVSEILESNGSSSMATVCAGSLSLMDAGVPIREAVGGISIGLVTDGQDAVLLTDIMGVEDHYGDMDFKIAGTRKGVTAIQLDLKIRGIRTALLLEASLQAREARFLILDKMHEAISAPREDVSPYAPRITSFFINPEKIGEVIGPGGKTIKKIIEETGVTIDIEDDGRVSIAATDKEAAQKAINIVKAMTEEPEVGKIYDATVKRIMHFGAFCEILPNKEGLVHVSELSEEYVKDINKFVKVGDQFKVKLVEIDSMGRLNLSKKQADRELSQSQ